jgi:hypothetical protein
LDRQTRIGIGATAALAIIGIVIPMITWKIAGPLMAIFGMVAIWGLWPLIPWTFQVGLPLGYAPLDRAAAKLYGQMQGTAAADSLSVPAILHLKFSIGLPIGWFLKE